jgi:hypothetical protein
LAFSKKLIKNLSSQNIQHQNNQNHATNHHHQTHPPLKTIMGNPAAGNQAPVLVKPAQYVIPLLKG